MNETQIAKNTYYLSIISGLSEADQFGLTNCGKGIKTKNLDFSPN